MTKRILHKLKLTEVSAVDRPCQEGARMVIMKRATPAGGDTGDNTRTKENPMPGDMEKVAAELEGQVSDLEAKLEKLMTQLESSEDPELAKAAEPLIQALEKANELNEKLQKDLETAKAEKDKVQKEAAVAKALAEMSEEERSYYKNFKTDKEKEEFLELDPEKRKEKLKAEKALDESVVIEGETISKRAVGEAAFTIFKKQAARIEKQEQALKKEREDREMSDLRKRADDDYSHVPGSTDERAAMLKALTTLDEPVRKSFEAVLQQSEKLAKSGFERVGSRGGKPADESMEKKAQDFESKLNKIRADFPKLSKQDSLKKARQENPDLFKAYQEHGEHLAANGGN